MLRIRHQAAPAITTNDDCVLISCSVCCRPGYTLSPLRTERRDQEEFAPRAEH